AYQLMRLALRDVATGKQYVALEFRDQADNGLDQRRLAGAIRPEQRNDLTRSDIDAGTAHDRHSGLIAGMKILNCEQPPAHACRLPRSASMTSGLPTTSDGVPSHMSRPAAMT